MDRKAKNITGLRSGRLVASTPTTERRNGQVVWKCKCDCGKIAYVRSNCIRNKRTISCGCSKIGKNAKDVTGLRSGRLVAAKPMAERRNGKIIWECKCDCGKKAYVSTENLVQKSVRSCGCLQKETAKDITGQRSGRLVAIRPTTKRKDKKVVWECKCDCGKIVYVRSSYIIKKRTISCGCSRIVVGMTRHSILEPDDIPIEMVKAKMALNKNRKLTERLKNEICKIV